MIPKKQKHNLKEYLAAGQFRLGAGSSKYRASSDEKNSWEG